jgi:hypothetical protein
MRTETQAQIALGRLLERVQADRRPESAVKVAELLARYLEVAELDASTRPTYQGYIRRTIGPALGSMELRKVRGPVLDTFYTRLRRCADVACTGRPRTEHVSFPPLVVQAGRRPAWQQVTDQIREAITSAILGPGDQLPSACEIAALNGLRLATARHRAGSAGRRGDDRGAPRPPGGRRRR